MDSYLLDAVFVVIAAVTAFAVSRCGGVRAGLWVIGIFLALIASLCLFEPMTQILIRTYVTNKFAWTWPYGRFLCLLAVFAVSLIFLYVVLRWMLPEDPELSAKIDLTIRWSSGLVCGYVVAAFLLIVLHTFPGPPDFGGHLPPEPKDRPGILMPLAPDYQLLWFTQQASEDVFPIGTHGELFPMELRSIGEESGRWSSFPRRYAAWRKKLDQQRLEREEQDRKDNAAGDNSVGEEPEKSEPDDKSKTDSDQ